MTKREERNKAYEEHRMKREVDLLKSGSKRKKNGQLLGGKHSQRALKNKEP